MYLEGTFWDRTTDFLKTYRNIQECHERDWDLVRTKYGWTEIVSKTCWSVWECGRTEYGRGQVYGRLHCVCSTFPVRSLRLQQVLSKTTPFLARQHSVLFSLPTTVRKFWTCSTSWINQADHSVLPKTLPDQNRFLLRPCRPYFDLTRLFGRTMDVLRTGSSVKGVLHEFTTICHDLMKTKI